MTEPEPAQRGRHQHDDDLRLVSGLARKRRHFNPAGARPATIGGNGAVSEQRLAFCH